MTCISCLQLSALVHKFANIQLLSTLIAQLWVYVYSWIYHNNPRHLGRCSHVSCRPKQWLLEVNLY